MLHMLNFAGAKTDSTANEAAPCVADSSATQSASGQQYIMPYDALVVGAYAFNDTITRARLNYPSYRDVGLPEIFPLNVLALASADFDICWWGENGPRVKKTEGLGIDSSDGVSTVKTIAAGVWLSTMYDPIPPGRRFTVRGTSAQTLVANAYTIGGITLDQSLPFGRYGVIGMQVTCAAAWAARLVFPNNASVRPGVVCGTTISILQNLHRLRAGMYGLLGSFEQTAPPQLEILGQAAGAQTAAVILDLVQY